MTEERRRWGLVLVLRVAAAVLVGGVQQAARGLVGVRVRQSKLVATAKRSGVLPPDADPDVWRRALRAEVQEWNGQRWLAEGVVAYRWSERRPRTVRRLQAELPASGSGRR